MVRATTLVMAYHGIPPSYGIILSADYTEKGLESLNQPEKTRIKLRLRYEAAENLSCGVAY